MKAEKALASGGAEISRETTDYLNSYRAAIAGLAASRERLVRLKEMGEGLRAELSRLELDKEAKLIAAAEAETPPEGDFDWIARLVTRVEVCKRKLAAVEKVIEEASREMELEVAGLKESCRLLWLSFRGWRIEGAKAQLIERMVGGCDLLTIDRVVMFDKNVDASRALEMAASDAEGVLSEARRLLDAVGACPGFGGPSYRPPPSVMVIETAEGTQKPPEQLVGPFSDRDPQMGPKEIQAEYEKMREEDPSLDLAGVNKIFAQRHPELFMTAEEVVQLNRNLDAPASKQPWRSPMIGSTRPVQEPQSGEPARDQIFETLNQR